MRENAERGFFNGSRPPYSLHKVPVLNNGRKRNRLEPDPDDSITAKVVRLMFNMADSDKGCKKIAIILNSEGYRTLSGKKWTRTTVHKILTNEAYIGTLVWGGRQGHPAIHSGEPPVRVANAWPAIIDKVTFNRVQKKMAMNRPKVIHPRTVPSFYILSGILFCSCGAAVTGHSAKSGKYHYYQCSRRLKQGDEACSIRQKPKEKLERLIIEQLKTRVLTDENLEALVTMVNEELETASDELTERLHSVDIALADVKARLSRLYDALETGKLGLDDLAGRIKELKSRQDELNATRVQIEADMVVRNVELVDLEMVKTYAQDLKVLLQEAEFTERKSFLRSFIKRIEINEKQAVVHYNLPIPRDKKMKGEKEVLPIDTLGGPSESIAQPKIKTFFELSLVPADYSTININP